MTIPSRAEDSALLLQPILYGEREPSDQCIGGETLPGSSFRCEVCGEVSTQSLARFRSKGASLNQHQQQEHRILHVVACTKASCWNSLFEDLEGGNICLGGKGVLSCTTHFAAEPITTTSLKSTKNDEWSGQACRNVNADTGMDMESLETQLAAIEGPSFDNGRNRNHTSNHQVIDQRPQSLSLNQASVFPRYELYTIKEPNAPRSTITNTRSQHQKYKDSDKIQAMLDRYLADETDESIRSALEASQTRQTNVCSDVDYCLEDEAPTADKVLHDYKERLYRAPRQVIRVGGTPLWSAYVQKMLLLCRILDVWKTLTRIVCPW